MKEKSPYALFDTWEMLIGCVCDESKEFHRDNPVSLKKHIIEDSIKELLDNHIQLSTQP